jgi:glycolate oxidase FAD binding subunit
VLSYDPADLTIVCEAGLTHTALADVLAPAGQMLPLDVPLPERATLGGTLATASAGLRRAYYGAPRDLALGLRVADAGGNLLKTGGRVVKNVTGYDMTRLYIGSLGTLGVTVAASFKLVPRPEAEVSVIGIFPERAPALEVAARLEAMAVRPSAVVVLHAHALPTLARLTPASGGHGLCVARFPGPIAAVARARAEAEALLRAAGARTTIPLDGRDEEVFWAAATEFTAISAPGAEAAMIRVAALPSDVADIVGMASSVASEHDLALRWVADAIAGVVWLRVSLSGITPPQSPFTFPPGLAALQSEAVARWCSSVLMACAPELKRNLPVWGAEPPGLSQMREIKSTFDPTGVLNPERFLTGL